MFWRKKKDSPVWRDRNGKIICNGDACPQTCDSRCPVWLNTEGLSLLQQNKVNSAIDAFKKATEIAPDFPDAFNNMGVAYGMSNRHKDARQSFQNALSLKKEYPSALRGLIVAEKNLGLFDDAYEHCSVYEKLTGLKAAELRQSIKSAQEEAQSSPVSIGEELIALGHKYGFLQSDQLTFVPELLSMAPELCQQIQDEIEEYERSEGNNDSNFLTLVWSALAGMGAVHFWNIDWSKLSSVGLYHTLTSESGVFAMDEFVMKEIDIDPESLDGQKMTQFLNSLSHFCLSMKKHHNEVSLSPYSIAMFIFGMAFQMNRIGMQ